MTIRREDLTAAAAAGLLPYRQIDPLLIFLLQRDIVAKRQVLLAQPHPRPSRGVPFLLAVALALAALALTVLRQLGGG